MNRAVLVKSCQKNRDRQAACSQSWAHVLRTRHVNVRFVEGGHAPRQRNADDGFFVAVDAPVGHTASLERMGLRLNVADQKAGNSLKLAAGLRFLLESYAEIACVFVCDDDTFVHPQRWLAHEPAGELEGRLYRPRNALEWKKNDGLPWLHGGAGWHMSRRVCQLYVKHCHERTSADDIVVARIAQQYGIEIVDRPEFYGDDRYGGDAGWVSAANSLMTCHPVTPIHMAALYEATSRL